MREVARRNLDLPPVFRPIILREVGDAFAHACTHAADSGAGTLVLVGRFDLAEFAVVLEPEEPLRLARPVFYAGMLALYETLAAAAPPEKPIAIEWPDAIYVDGGLIGGGRLAWPRGIAEAKVPPWLVFGASIRTTSMISDTGLYPLSTALEAEGFEDRAADELVARFARHLMGALDRWNGDGPAALTREYAATLRQRGKADYVIANDGTFVEQVGRASKRRELATALASPSWLDSRTGGPRL
jgi:biotin-(acetyl-CoA carboxylase) ligase